jgi:hypothetical protein
LCWVFLEHGYQCVFLEENTSTRSMYSLPVVVCILLVHRYSSLYCVLAFYCVVWSKKWATQVSHSLYCGFPCKGMSVSPFDIVHETGSEISSFRCAPGEGPFISMLSVHYYLYSLLMLCTPGEDSPRTKEGEEDR